MAKAKAKQQDPAANEPNAEPTNEPNAEPSPASLVPALPEDWEFTINENMPIPEAAKKQRTPDVPFYDMFDKMGHNSNIFVPMAFWVKRGSDPSTLSLQRQRDKLKNYFIAWRKRGDANAVEAKSKWRITTVGREIGTDPEYPQMVGVRAWKVDSTR